VIEPWYRLQSRGSVLRAQAAALNVHAILLAISLAMSGPFAALLLREAYSITQTWPLIVLPWVAFVPIFWFWSQQDKAGRIDQRRSVQTRVVISATLGLGWSAAMLAYIPDAPFEIQAILLCSAAFMASLSVAALGPMPVTCMVFAGPINLTGIFLAVAGDQDYADYLALFLAMAMLAQVAMGIGQWRAFALAQFRLIANSDALVTANIGWLIENRVAHRRTWSPNLLDLLGISDRIGADPIQVLRGIIPADEQANAPPSEDVAGEWHYKIRPIQSGLRLIREIATVIHDDQRRIKLVYRNFQDVTASEEARRDLEHLNQAKNHFIANVSHEIRTPANGLVGTLRLLSDTSLSNEQREFLNIAYESATALRVMLDDLLDVARLESASLALERKSFSIRALVDTEKALFAGKADENGLAFNTRVAPDVPPFLMGDPGRLRQILNNLISNAIKYTMIGSVIVEVDTAYDQAIAKLRIRVNDTGIGFDKAAQEKLFGALTKPDTSLTRRYGETGMGLLIARGLAQRMAGELTFESEPGRGSAFTVTLPLEISESIPDQSSIEQAPHLLRTLKVFAADDHPVNRMLLRSILLKWGHDVETFENGQELLTALQTAIPDLIVMDIQMPVMDGIAATRLIRKMPAPYRQIPILGFTADADPKHRLQFLQEGMDDCLVKPMNFDLFAKALDDLTSVDRPVL
jgi:signal transduction histidine kinase/CheY-like chemotaxis protein